MLKEILLNYYFIFLLHIKYVLLFHISSFYNNYSIQSLSQHFSDENQMLFYNLKKHSSNLNIVIKR